MAKVLARRTYFALCNNPSQHFVEETIEGKRIQKGIVESIIRDSLKAGVALTTSDGIVINDLPLGIRLLDLKMSRGNISLQNIRRAKDHKYSTESLLQKWMYKYGVEKADSNFGHLKAIVGNECQEAYDLAYCSDKPFGQKMLIDIRERLRSRIKDEPELFFGCIYEHLLGVSGILTEMCEVWWSEEFEISGGQ